MGPLEVRLQVAAPVAIGASPFGPCLDQVLAAIQARREGCVYPRGQQEWRQQVAVPGLAQRDGIALGSTLRPVGRFTWHYSALPRTASLGWLEAWARPHHWITNSGPYLTRVTGVRAVMCAEWRWYAVGDPEVVRDLLGDLLAVGGKRAAGFGAVVSTEVRQTNSDWSVMAVSRGGSTRLMRPVPVRLLKAWGVDADVLEPNTFAMAYAAPWPGMASWDTARSEPCLVPVLAQEDVLT